MKAIETIGIIDSKGFLKLDKPIKTLHSKVKVIILFPEDNELDDEMFWLKTISNNPAFDFLRDKGEDIYSISDGKPIND